MCSKNVSRLKIQWKSKPQGWSHQHNREQTWNGPRGGFSGTHNSLMSYKIDRNGNPHFGVSSSGMNHDGFPFWPYIWGPDVQSKRHQINTEDPWVSTLCLNQPNTDVSALSLCIFRKSLLLYKFNIWVTWKPRLASRFDRCPLLNHLWVRQDPGIPDWDEYITSILKEAAVIVTFSGLLCTTAPPVVMCVSSGFQKCNNAAPPDISG